MANVHFKRQLIHTCDVYRGTSAQSGTDGEVTQSYAYLATHNCRYVQRREGIARESAGFPMQLVDRVLFDTGTDVLETDQIRNIAFRDDGTAVDAGPFTIEELLHRNDTPGRHHISVKVEKID